MSCTNHGLLMHMAAKEKSSFALQHIENTPPFFSSLLNLMACWLSKMSAHRAQLKIYFFIFIYIKCFFFQVSISVCTME